MATLDQLKKFGVKFYREGNRTFGGIQGVGGLSNKAFEISDPQSLGIDLSQIPDITYNAAEPIERARVTGLPQDIFTRSFDTINSQGLDRLLGQYESAFGEVEKSRLAAESAARQNALVTPSTTPDGAGAAALNAQLAAKGLPPLQQAGQPTPQVQGLNTATSIVDYLKSRGFQAKPGEKFPFFEQRGQLYESLGLGSSLGEFRGSGEQNTALLNLLTQSERNVGVSVTPENIFNVARTGNKPIGAADIVSGAGGTTGTSSPTGPALPAGIGDLFKTLSPQQIADEALKRFTGSSTFALQKEGVESEKAALQLKAQADTEQLISSLAAKGLTFSGIRSKGEASVGTDKLAGLLGIDRKFAMIIAKGLESSAQEVAKEAQQGSQEALRALEKLGYTVNPLTNRIEPTLEAKRLELSEKSGERAEASAQRAEEMLLLSQIREARLERAAGEPSPVDERNLT